MKKIKIYKLNIFHFIPIISSFVLYIIINLISIIFFRINLFNSFYILIDFLLFLLLSYLLFYFSKRIKLYFFIQSIVAFIFYIGSSIKVSFFGSSIIIDDLFSLKEAFLALSMINIFYIIFIILFLLTTLFLIILNLKITKKGIILFSALFLFVLSISFFNRTYKDLISKIDKKYLFWNQQENYKHNGPIFFMLNEYVRSNNSSNKPNKEEVDKALNNINKHKISSNITNILKENKPNIHFILVESLWDITDLKNAHYSQDPFYKGFREMDIHKNKIISPTFEGKTADPEFELLCGIPILKNNIPFQTEIKNNIPCLPNLLKEEGYETNVFHADWATFYNRDKVYKKIGFDNYYSIKNFNKDDLNNGNLSDKSFLNQSYNLINKEKSNPKFNYYLTISTHTPYILNNKERPNIIENNLNNDWIYNYSNSIYYSTKEIYEFILFLKEKDPNSIIIITGDHAPFLGNNKEVYNKTNTLDDLLLYSTPIIFLEKGELKIIEKNNMFRFGEYLLKSLGIDTKNTIFNLFNSEELLNIRPLYVDKNSEQYIDIRESNYCKEVCKIKNLESYIIIYNDLLFGKQYSIR